MARGESTIQDVMKFLFKGKHHQFAEQHGWNLVPEAAVHITSHTVRTILDAGTGDGRRLDYFLRVFPAAIVHCFEPAQAVFALLEKQFKNHRRVILNRMALCGSSGLSQVDEISSPCMRPMTLIPGADDLAVPENHLVRITVDDYCRVCRIDSIDLLRLPGTATEVALYNGARIQLADQTIRALLIPLKPQAAEKQGAVVEVSALNRGLERQGFVLQGVRGSRDGGNDFTGHMLFVQQPAQ